MHYAGARFYMSALGRWGTTDPILEEKGPGALLQQDPRLLTMSAYNYTFNDPTNLLDPDGFAPEGCCKSLDITVSGQAFAANGQVETSLTLRINADGMQLLGGTGMSGGAYTAPGGNVGLSVAGTSEGLSDGEGSSMYGSATVAAGVGLTVSGSTPRAEVGDITEPHQIGDALGESSLSIGVVVGTPTTGASVGMGGEAPIATIKFGGSDPGRSLGSQGGMAPADATNVVGMEGGIQAPDHRTRDDRLDSGSTVSPELRDDEQ